MRYKNTWQWILIPAVKISGSGARKPGHVLLLVKETPYNQHILEIYGTGLRVELVRIVDLN